MSDGREAILGAVRGGLGRGPLAGPARQALEARLAAPAPNLVPERGRADAIERVARFIDEAGRVETSIARVARPADVPAAVAAYLAEHNLAPVLKIAPMASLEDIPWSQGTTLDVAFGRAEESDATGVSQAVAGIAETGTLVLASGADSPTGLNFLPETHVVVLEAGAVVGAFEDVWRRLRDAGAMPRAVNFVTGPSRTADIELTLLLGAHGPKRLHVVVVDDQAP